jgi:hypothetical protein
MQQNRRPDFFRQVLRELPVLVPAGVIFAVVQGGDLVDWLIGAAAVAVVGLGMGWLLYQRERLKQKPVRRTNHAKASKRSR